MNSPLNYAFAVGKVRVLEKFLIKAEVFEEAAESDIAEALRLFVEADLYDEALLRVRDGRQLEAALERELFKLRRAIGDLILDKELLGLLEINDLRRAFDILKVNPSDFLKEYFMHLTDMHNIKTFLRLRVSGEPKESLEGHIVCEGFMGRDFFLKLYGEDLPIFLNRLEYIRKGEALVDYASFLREPVQNLQERGSFIAVEKAMNDFLEQVLKPAKYISFGPEPLLAYYYAKVNEINLIRMVALAKFNGVSGELVKERLSAVYA